MFDEQPSLIQEYEPSSSGVNYNSPWDRPKPAPTPLVLIHDGGGTIFPYYCLGDLDRSVYGIANPNYDSGAAWEGGIPEMARHYCDFIRSALPSGGDVILGGWSLGGLISLEVARQLAAGGGNDDDDREARLNVVGIVMVDSSCPLRSITLGRQILRHDVQWNTNTREETKEKVMRCFSEALRMAADWKLPAWEGMQARNGTIGSRVVTEPLRPPPVVLLRAIEHLPRTEHGVSRVDFHRSDPHLGWGLYRKDLITRVIDIPGHHFNLFHTEALLDSTTEAIKKACWTIEMMGSSSAF